MTEHSMQGKKIILVRHGETEWNRLRRFQGRTDIPLNQKGNDQARALALALKDEALTAIYSSPLGRAMETAQHIGSFHPATPVLKEQGLVEMDLGEFEGMDARQWAAEHVDFRKVWERKPATLPMPGGESLRQVQLRAVEALERIAESHGAGSTLLLCAHNFVIATLLCFALGIDLDQFRQLRQDTAALNILHNNGTAFEVETVNDCRHLE